MGDKKIREPTYYGRTGKDLEHLNYAVSDEMIKQERDFNRLLNEMEDEINKEYWNEQTGDKKQT